MKSQILVLAGLVATLGLALPSKATSLQSNERTVQTPLLAQSSWVTVEPKDAYFKVEMPGNPKKVEGEMGLLEVPGIPGDFLMDASFSFPTLSGQDFKMPNPLTAFSVSNSQESFNVFYVDQRLFLAERGEQQMDRRWIGDILKSLEKPHLLNKVQKISYPGPLGPSRYPGREVREVVPQGVFAMRFYLFPSGRIYILIAQSSEENVNRFLNSWKYL